MRLFCFGVVDVVFVAVAFVAIVFVAVVFFVDVVFAVIFVAVHRGFSYGKKSSIDIP